MPKAPPRKMTTVHKIPWHNLAHFCCAKCCHSKFRLFQPPRPSGRAMTLLTMFPGAHAGGTPTKIPRFPLFIVLWHCTTFFGHSLDPVPEQFQAR